MCRGTLMRRDECSGLPQLKKGWPPLFYDEVSIFLMALDISNINLMCRITLMI
jgi:hypothetical protein